MRLAADLLTGAIEGPAAALDQRFPHTGETPVGILATYAADHDRAVARP